MFGEEGDDYLACQGCFVSSKVHLFEASPHPLETNQTAESSKSGSAHLAWVGACGLSHTLKSKRVECPVLQCLVIGCTKIEAAGQASSQGLRNAMQ